MKKLLSILALSLISFGAMATEESLVQDVLYCEGATISKDKSLETLLINLGGVVYHVPESQVMSNGITEFNFPFDKGEVVVKLGENPSLVMDTEEGISFHQCS